MGAAKSTTITSTVPESYHRMFPLHGLGLSHVEEFIEAYGGRQAFEGWTSDDVCREIIKPLTKDLKCSYVDLLRAIQHPACREGKKADVFVSHAWKCNFLVLVDSLLQHFADRLDTIVVWFDVFTINQHTWLEWWDLESTCKGIKDIGNTVMVLTPWQDPVPLTRAWCLYELGHQRHWQHGDGADSVAGSGSSHPGLVPDELYCTHKEKCNFEVAMGSKEREDFLTAIHAGNAANVVNSMLAKVDVAKSEAGKEDKEKIHQKVMESVGFSQLNSMVLTLMRSWVIEVARKEYDRRKNTLGDRHIETLTSMSKLGELYQLQGRHKEAELLFKDCLEIQRAVLGERHLSTLTSMSNLASLYKNQGRYDKAEPLYKDCLEMVRAVLGERHPDTLRSINNLASLYKNQGRYVKAEPLYKDCLEMARAVLGERHPDTLASMNNLAVLYDNLGRYDEAEPLYKDCLEMKRAVLGERHPDTLTSMNNLAMLYDNQGRYVKAEPLYKDCLEMRRAVLGERHPETLRSMNNLALMYKNQGRYGEANILRTDI
eukprot:CAMPEP_0201112600 /NCGR_PEP_ID=MMETSP0812-20130820/77351_1 /ASSEMBLY_ACC=CAM_ASM_000668 /TAXON_ID=98059 /ORGANISM="Dinobryon sp., Strain UTEXLB2267" /LENGTH=542 /DNA_ID=CAMNT_0047375985 /DNA_START=92 /DNA_END=1721 /DNA_ORIENTATION=+